MWAIYQGAGLGESGEAPQDAVVGQVGGRSVIRLDGWEEIAPCGGTGLEPMGWLST